MPAAITATPEVSGVNSSGLQISETSITATVDTVRRRSADPMLAWSTRRPQVLNVLCACVWSRRLKSLVKLADVGMFFFLYFYMRLCERTWTGFGGKGAVLKLLENSGVTALEVDSDRGGSRCSRQPNIWVLIQTRV